MSPAVETHLWTRKGFKRLATSARADNLLFRRLKPCCDLWLEIGPNCMCQLSGSFLVIKTTEGDFSHGMSLGMI